MNSVIDGCKIQFTLKIMTTPTNWHLRFLALAAHTATWSRDPEKKVGAVIVRPDKTVASLGFNGFPRGVADNDRLHDKVTKLELVVHAEMNAILHAREPLHGYTMYIWPLLPCTRCAASIIQSGIKHIVAPPLKNNSNWKNSTSLANSMLQEAGVTVTVINESVDLPLLYIELE
jgi:dCMP deaminase